MAEHPNQILAANSYISKYGVMIWASVEKTLFAHILVISTKSWPMSISITSKTPEGSAINLFLLLVKNKNGSAGAFCFGTSILSNYDESLAAILL